MQTMLRSLAVATWVTTVVGGLFDDILVPDIPSIFDLLASRAVTFSVYLQEAITGDSEWDSGEESKRMADIWCRILEADGDHHSTPELSNTQWAMWGRSEATFNV